MTRRTRGQDILGKPTTFLGQIKNWREYIRFLWSSEDPLLMDRVEAHRQYANWIYTTCALPSEMLGEAGSGSMVFRVSNWQKYFHSLYQEPELFKEIWGHFIIEYAEECHAEVDPFQKAENNIYMPFQKHASIGAYYEKRIFGNSIPDSNQHKKLFLLNVTYAHAKKDIGGDSLAYWSGYYDNYKNKKHSDVSHTKPTNS